MSSRAVACRTSLVMLEAVLLSFMVAVLGSPPASASAPIETMPLWRVQVRVATSLYGTDGHPAIRFNSSSTGVRTLNPPATSAFDAGTDETHDVKLFGTPSEITMLRIGIDTGQWCLKKVDLVLNGRVAFSYDSAQHPGDVWPLGCYLVKPGKYLEFSSADLRGSAQWQSYAVPPLPTALPGSQLRATVSDVTGSTLLGLPPAVWNSAVPLTVADVDTKTVRYSYGVSPDPVEFYSETPVFLVRYFIGGDGRLHAKLVSATACSSTCDLAGPVITQLNTALNRMTAFPTPHPLTFSVDSGANLTWRVD
jgi:hypothetical protein